jgi:DMSO/TMAO reductase YedYZ molybdopterin-dependent catalytic subunit
MSENPKDEMSRISRRSFLWAGAAVLGAYGGIRWLGSRVDDGGTPWPFRRALEFNESVWKDAFSPKSMAPTFARSAVTDLKVNGMEGMAEDFNPADWTLSVEGVFGKDEPVEVTLDEIKKMPRVEFTTQLCCIEGWNSVVTWAGVRFSDFMLKYPPAIRSGDRPDVARRPYDLVRYVSLSTPDDGYYVGLDMPSALHPQTLLCYEMNGAPLTSDHGAPLRLVIPVKYGIKNIKRIGTISYTDERPKDYWAEEGYDWYAGL